MRKHLIFLALIGNFALSQNYIAVVDFSGNGISSKDASTLTDRFRLELFKTGKFVVAEREMMNQVLEEQGFQLSGCASDECLVEMGKLIGVSDIIGGSVSKFGEIYSVSLRMVDIELGTIVQSAIYDHEGRFEDLLLKVMKKSAEQFAIAIDPEYQEKENIPSDQLSNEKIVADQPYSKEVNFPKISIPQAGFTLIGGLNISSVNYTDNDFADTLNILSKMGLYIGAETVVGPMKVGAAFIQRGAKLKVFIFGNTMVISDTYNYLSGYGIYPISIREDLSVFGGLQLGKSIGGTREIEYRGDSQSEDLKGKDFKLDYGLLFGLDYSLNTNMGVRASYYFGLANVDKEAKSKFNFKNRGIGISVLYKM